jgi:PAS domain S-box-containing protein
LTKCHQKRERKAQSFFESLALAKKPFSGVQVPSLDGHGNLVSIEISGVPFFDDTGKLIGFRGITRDITYRKKAEEALKHVNERFEMAQRSAGVGVWDWNVKTGHIEWTTEMFKLLGLDPKITVASFEVWNSVLHPDDKEKARAKINEALKTHSFLDNEYRVVRQNGQIVWINALGQGEYDAANQPVRMTGICMDITERKKDEQILKESEEQFRKAVEGAPIPTIMQAENGQVLQISHSWTELTGYTINHIRSFDEWITKAVYGEYASQVGDHLHELFIGDKRSIGVEFALRTIKGDSRHWSFSASSPGILRDGRRFIVGMAVDITERKQMQEKLEEYAKNLEGLVEERTKKLEANALYARGLIEASLAPLVTINGQGKITDVNKATETMTGRSREELVGSDFSDYFVRPDEARRGYLQVFQNGYVRDYPLSVRSKSGKIVEVLYNATLFKNQEGKTVGVFVAARDMTEHKRAEEALLNERKRLFDALETLPVMVCLLTPDHHVAFANRSFRERFGNSEDRYCYDYCFGNKQPCSFCESYKPLETGKPHHWEVNASDGSVIDAYDFRLLMLMDHKKFLKWTSISLNEGEWRNN